MEEIKNYFFTPKPYVSLGIVALCVIVWIIIKRAMARLKKSSIAKDKSIGNLNYAFGTVKTVIAVFAVITVLQINGINVTSLVTGLGVASIVVGFALEDLLKDIINGANIVFDGFFKVDDDVRFVSATGEIIEGKVIAFNLKATKISDFNTGNTVSISNRNISEIHLLSDWVVMSVPSPYSVAAEVMRNVCGEMCKRIEKLADVKSCEFMGTDRFDESQITYMLRVHCIIDRKLNVRLDALGVIQDVLAEHGIEVPFNQLDVHVDNLN